MGTTQNVGEGLTFEKVWAGIQELRELQKETALQMKELQRETALQMKESQRETDRQMKESQRETDRQMKETDRRVGEMTNRFGEMVEYMIVPNLVEKFRELGFEFEKTHRDTEIKDYKHHIFTEIDAFLENGDKVMIVEIKNKLKTGDIDDHIERMGKLRQYADLHDDTRKYLGAIAGVVISGSEKTYALKNGFYVVEPSGDTFKITKPEGKYQPREW